MKLSLLLEALGIREGFAETDITDLVYDSRKAGPGCAFFCLRGSAADGHKYAPQAAKAGAAAVIAEEPVEAPGAQVILVPDTRKALALMSAAFFRRPAEGDITVIGVTGTKGKTTTAYMIASILEAAGHKTGVMGTIGVKIGDTLIQTDNTTPASYEVQKYLRQMADAGCDYCVMEASSIGLKDLRVYGFPFAVGVFTNFSEDHIGGVEHKDMREYMESKAKLFSMCKVGVVNGDDPSLPGILRGHTCEVRTYGFGEGLWLTGHNCRHLNKPGFLGVAFEVTGALQFTAEVGIPGRFNAYNALAAMGACQVLGIPVEAMKQGLAAVKVKGRVEPVPVPGDYTLLLDYAHNGVGMENILTTLREYNPSRLICMFGPEQPAQGPPVRDGGDLRQIGGPLRPHRRQLPVRGCERHHRRHQGGHGKDRRQVRRHPRPPGGHGLVSGKRQARGHRGVRRQGPRGLPGDQRRQTPLRRAGHHPGNSGRETLRELSL